MGTPVWAAPGDDAAGAKSLIDIWNRNESKMVPLRKDVARIRAKRIEQERRLRKERDQKKRAAIRTRIAELVEDYRQKFANPYISASRGYIDDVIEPRFTRPRLINALEMLANKRDVNPAKKHGNIPL